MWTENGGKRMNGYLLRILVAVTQQSNFSQTGREWRYNDAQNGEPFSSAQRHHEESCSGK